MCTVCKKMCVCLSKKSKLSYYSDWISVPEVSIFISPARFGAAGAVAASPFALLMGTFLTAAPTAGASSLRHRRAIQHPSGGSGGTLVSLSAAYV